MSTSTAESPQPRVQSLLDWLRPRFELSRGGRSNLSSMEGLRGLAVFLVFLVHYVTLIDPWVPLQSPVRDVGQQLTRVGHSGVDLFFVLSGYLIYGALISRPQPFATYIARRLQRLYPPFTVMLLVYVGLSIAFPAQSNLPDSPWVRVLYVAANFAMLPGLFPITPIMSVAWSLSYELFYYLAIPLVIGVLGLRAWRPWARLALFLGIAVTGVWYCAIDDGPVQLLMFICGMVLFDASHHSIQAPGSIAAVMTLALGLVLVPAHSHSSQLEAVRTGVLFVCFFVVCWACFARPESYVARAFSWTPARWLGNMSYSYYLVHGLALKCGFGVIALMFPPAHSSSALFAWLLAPCFALTVLPSLVLYLGVERPLSLRGHVSEGRLQLPSLSQVTS